MLITQSTHEPNTYFLFRSLGDNSYSELKINIKQDAIVSCSLLTPSEKLFLSNTFNKTNFKIDFELLNYNINDLKFN